MSFFWENKQKKQLRCDLLSIEAENKAKKMNDEAKDKMNKYSQIRKFYDEAISHKTFILSRPDGEQDEIFKQRLPYIKMMNAKLVYSQARGYLSSGFVKMIKECINEVKDLDDFYAFTDFFEAFLAFYRQYKDKEGKDNTQYNNNRNYGRY